MLEALQLVKKFGTVRALDGFSLTVEPGEIVGLIGHNGAGKTTLAHTVCGLIRPDQGRVRVAGRTPRTARGLIGLAPQHLALHPTVTPRETLRLFGGLYGVRRRDLDRAVAETAEALRLTDLLDRRVGTLSGGQQRRAQAAAAMVHRPSLLLLDEPTAGVDLETRSALLASVRARAREGAAVVYTTHYLPELAELEATLVLARHGRVIARGTIPELTAAVDGSETLDGLYRALHEEAAT